jgi:hypothetical protein
MILPNHALHPSEKQGKGTATVPFPLLKGDAPRKAKVAKEWKDVRKKL